VDPTWLYPGTIVTLLILIFMQWQTNSKKTMILLAIILGYIVFSHETGYTLGQLKEEAISSFDESVGNSDIKKKFETPSMRAEEANRSVK